MSENGWHKQRAPDQLEPDPRRVLRPRERQIVSLASQGKMNKEIAFSLGLTEKSVSKRVCDILRVLGIRNRTELAAQYWQGLLKVDQ